MTFGGDPRSLHLLYHALNPQFSKLSAGVVDTTYAPERVGQLLSFSTKMPVKEKTCRLLDVKPDEFRDYLRSAKK